MRDDPFAKLGALDQKLFTATPPPASPPGRQRPRPTAPSPTPAKEPWNQASKEPTKQGTLEPRTRGAQVETDTPTIQSVPAFSLVQRPDRQNTYAFTGAELERLEDAKIAITRRYDLSVTKNDLVRCAVHLLLEDFERRGERSAVVERLRRQRP